jgi:hypothetical protein
MHLEFRPAIEKDVSDLVMLFADNILGAPRVVRIPTASAITRWSIATAFIVEWRSSR